MDLPHVGDGASSAKDMTRGFRLRGRLPLVLPLMLLALAMIAAPAPAQVASSAPGLAGAAVRQGELEGRVLWMDGTANIGRLNSRAGVASILDRCVRARINTVVIDVKPLSGQVLYNSQVAPRLHEWRGVAVPPGYDLLATALEEGKRRGLKIYANINVFSAGHKLVGAGPAFNRVDQQAVIYDVERSVQTPAGSLFPVMIGLNRTPTGDSLSLYDDSFGASRTFLRGETYALIVGDLVEMVQPGDQAAPGGVRIPAGGYLLVGQGQGALWLQDNVKRGDILQWRASRRLLRAADAPSETVAIFLNPADQRVRDYELRIVEEIVSGYEIDGIVFDRMRYPGLQGDFSPVSRMEFEKFVHTPIAAWPEDIYQIDPRPGRPIIRGPHYKAWLEWRATNIRTWLQQASDIVRSRRPAARIGTYVGSWYPSYYTVGVNWGSPTYRAGYDWMSTGYPATGYADLLDWVSTGCYYPLATREQARAAGLDENMTVEAAAQISTTAVADRAFVYAGIYVQDYRGAPQAFVSAIRAARDNSHGVMIFDLSQLDDYGFWHLLESEFRQERRAPHDVPDLLEGVRQMRDAVELIRR